LSGTGKKTKSITRLLLEKYYHSRGALSCDEGNFNQSIRHFRKALALDEQAYTRAHLGRAYFEKGDVERALTETAKAIEISPDTAQYYLQRSRMWKEKGEMERAEADHRAAVRIDSRLENLDTLRRTLQIVENAFGEIGQDNARVREEVGDPRLAVILQEMGQEQQERRKAVNGQSCIVPCPAFCCHFSHETLLHGLTVGPWKLQAIRRYLKERGLKEQDLLASIAIGEDKKVLRLFPPDHVLAEKGKHRIYFPKRTRKHIGSRLWKTRPMGRGYSEIPWITGKSRACTFLSKGRCSIHNEGGDPALSSCKEFLCLTGFVFLILHYYGAVDRDQLVNIEMAELNRIAVEASPRIAEIMLGNGNLTATEQELVKTVARIMEADKSGDATRVEEGLGQYRQLRKERDAEQSQKIMFLKADLKNLMTAARRVSRRAGRIQ
jgi:tetratricopeptide (TPR) repeat protein